MNHISIHPVLRALAICLACAASFLTSCEKGDNPAAPLTVPEMNAPCILQPPTISIEPFGGSTPATRAAVAIKEERQAFNIGEELGNIITLGNSKPEENPQTRALANGTFYRIVVYSLTEWNNGTLKVYEQRLCKTGQTGYFNNAGDKTDPIYLYPGDYRIFVYSFNKTTYDSKLAKLADGAVNVPLAAGDDFLSSDIISKNITAAQLGTNVALGTITLKHRCCRLTGTLTAEAFEGSTGIAASPAPSLSVGGVSTAGNWSIKNSNISTTTTDTQAISLAKSGNNYTGTVMLLPMSGKPLTTSYNFKANGATKNVTATNKSINSSTTFVSGGSYSFTVKAIGAYVLTVPANPATTGIQIGSYTWAYANLDHTGVLETYPWVSGKWNGDDNDYWRWNVKTADTKSEVPDAPSTWSVSTDPCRAYLGSSWKIPPKTYFDNLVGYKLVSKRVYINGIFATTSSYGSVNSGTLKGCVFLDTDRSTCIFLPAAGVRIGSKYYFTTGSSGSYWSATLSPLSDSNTSFAYALSFSSTDCSVGEDYNHYGYLVRCSQ